jgi:CheY-like chemotaxis protein
VSRAPTTVLIVDDEFAIVEALTEILTWEGYAVRSAVHGRAALEVLEEEQVDIILMDVMMPVMGGVEAAAAIKADPRWRNTPIILMSAGPLPEMNGSHWGEMLRKPFPLDALLRALQTAIAGRAGGGE